MKQNNKSSRFSLRKLMSMSLVAAILTLGSFSASAAQQAPPQRPQTGKLAPGQKVVPPPMRPDAKKKAKRHDGRKDFRNAKVQPMAPKGANNKNVPPPRR